jgi:hypothetical protein
MDLATPPRSTTRESHAAPGAAGDVHGVPASTALRLAGTSALNAVPADDPRLAALRRACALLEGLEVERRALDQRLEAARKLDPMRQATGRTALDAAVEETRELVRQLDELLCSAAESARSASLTHPKDRP